MKITADDYTILERAIKLTIGRTGLSLDNYLSLGLTAKQYRWDLLDKSQLTIGDGATIDGDVNIYAYATKTHLDTALRRITKTR